MAAENVKVLSKSLCDILPALANKNLERHLQLDGGRAERERREKKTRLLTEALETMTPTVLRELTCVLQEALFETPENNSPFLIDLFEFLRNKSASAEKKLKRHGYPLNLSHPPQTF